MCSSEKVVLHRASSVGVPGIATPVLWYVRCLMPDATAKVQFGYITHTYTPTTTLSLYVEDQFNNQRMYWSIGYVNKCAADLLNEK